jgi:hypothetical protein
MSDPIVIDHNELQILSNSWGQRQRDAEDRQSEFNWGTQSPVTTSASPTGKARGNLGIQWTTKLGVAGYAPGNTMSDKIEGIRKNLAERIKEFGDHAYELHWGLDNLMNDSEACEHFNTMTADNFNAEFPAAPG